MTDFHPSPLTIGSIELPNPVVGTFEERHLDLPPEVLVQEVIEACRQRFAVAVEEVRVTDEDVHFNLPRVLAS